MAKKPEITKTQAVHDYLKTHPKAMSPEIAEALTKQGFTLTVAHAANIKSKLTKLSRARKAAKSAAAVSASPAPAPASEKPAKPGDTITLEQIKAVSQTVRTIGGFGRLKELLEVIREVGGLKKFKDLLEAMAAAEKDDIPF
ncbi:MAG: hypothetical protein ABSG68_02220 [Thermoguttaceae bacterium]|jgi:acetamidase/formamidase